MLIAAARVYNQSDAQRCRDSDGTDYMSLSSTVSLDPTGIVNEWYELMLVTAPEIFYRPRNTLVFTISESTAIQLVI